MSLSWIDPHFNTAASVLALGLLAYLICVEPLLGRRMYGRLAAVRDDDPDALTRFFRLTLLIEWAWALVVEAVIALAPGIQAADLGVAWPFGGHVAAAAGFALYVIVLQVLSGLAMRRRARQNRSVPGQKAFSAILPRTSIERRMAIAVAITAGICEELLCRGLLIATGVGVFGLSPYPAGAGAVLVFALAHLYQGWGGVLGTGLIGVVMTGLYFATGSLLLPIVVHIVIDMRALVLVPAATPTPARA